MSQDSSDTTRSTTRARRRGFYWQDVFATWILLRCWAEPAEGIVQVDVEGRHPEPLDDVVIHRRDRLLEFHQLKHTVDDDDGRFSGASLFGESAGPSLISRLYGAWSRVRDQDGIRVEVHVDTNASPSTDSTRNLLLSVQDFERRVLQPIRRGVVPSVDEHICSELQRLTGAPDRTALFSFLDTLHVNCCRPSDNELRASIAEILENRLLRPRERIEPEVETLIGRVYDLATRPDGPFHLTRADIERELRKLFAGVHRRAVHQLDLPERHLPRPTVTNAVLSVARELGRGYVFVEGPPGCGKTTLATWIADSEESDEIVVRYHAYRPGEDGMAERASRARSFSLVTELLDALREKYSESIGPRVPTPEAEAEATQHLWNELERLGARRPRLLLIDGIDHVLRLRIAEQEALFGVFRREPPPGIVFVLFGQPDWPYPPWVRRMPRISIPAFSAGETRELVCRWMEWNPDDIGARAVADAMHARTHGNPLSLFSNLNSVEALGDPAAVSAAMDGGALRLLGEEPHRSYSMLLEDLEPLLDERQVVRRELCAWLAVAQTTLTTDRLRLAFPGAFANEWQAREILDRLKPVLVPAGEGHFRLFHDDFRRFAEGSLSESDRVAAHRKQAGALRDTWSGPELSALAESLWLGDSGSELVGLPGSKSLEEWLGVAPGSAVLNVFRLGLAAALQSGDEVTIVRTGFAYARATQAVPLEADLDEPEWRRDLRSWSFVVPPVEVDSPSLLRRARALRAAARACRSDPGLAEEVARRFLVPLSQLPDSADPDWNGFESYTVALTYWLLRSGRACELPGVLNARPDLHGWIVRAVDGAVSAERDHEVLSIWSAALAPAAGELAFGMALVALEHLLAGRDIAAEAIVAALLRRGEDLQPPDRRDLAVLAAFVGLPVDYTALDREAGFWWGSGFPSSKAEGWRQIFFSGYVEGRLHPSVDLDLIDVPDGMAETLLGDHDIQDNLRLGRLLWRAGVATGLAHRARGLLSRAQLDSAVRPFIDNGVSGLDSKRWLLDDAARIYLPLLARAMRDDQDLRQHFATTISASAEQAARATGSRAMGVLEALWQVDPETWRRLACAAVIDPRPGDSDPYSRREWFVYWRDRCEARSIGVPGEFLALSRIAAVGVDHESDNPAWLAVRLLSAAVRTPEAEALEVRRLVGLLMRLAREGEGARAARRLLPDVLGVGMVGDPELFRSEYLRATAGYDIGEPFGALPGEVALNVLRDRGRSWTVDELLALWHWVAAAPGSFAREGTGNEVPTLVSALLNDRHAADDAARVQEWADRLVWRDVEDAAPREDSEVHDADAWRVEDVTTRWFNSYWAGAEHRRLVDYVAEHGDEGWRRVCSILAPQVATKPALGGYEVLAIVDNLPDVRHLSPTAAGCVYEEAVRHLEEKVRFQPPPGRAQDNAPAAATLIAAVVHLVARGLRVLDAETVLRSARALAELAGEPGIRPAVERELIDVIQAGDERPSVFAMLALRRVPSPLDERRRVLMPLRDHPNAWVRSLANTLLGLEPKWTTAWELLGTSGLVAPGAETTSGEAGSLHYVTPASVRENYVGRLQQLLDIEEDEVRRLLFRAESELPTLPERSLGWGHSRGPALLNHRVADAAARVVSGLGTRISDAMRSALLATTAPTDPWLAVCPPLVPAPDGWVELAFAEERRDDQHVSLLRGLGLCDEPKLADGTAVPREIVGKIGAHAMKPSFPRNYAWIAEQGPSPSPPSFESHGVLPLCFFNSPFTALPRSRFTLVPRWNLPIFRGLRFEVHDRPCWVHAERGPVVVAAYGERNTGRRNDGPGHPSMSWWTGWYVEPDWAKETLLVTTAMLIRFWRRESAPREYGKAKKEELLVDHGFDEIVRPSATE